MESNFVQNRLLVIKQYFPLYVRETTPYIYTSAGYLGSLVLVYTTLLGEHSFLVQCQLIPANDHITKVKTQQIYKFRGY